MLGVRLETGLTPLPQATASATRPPGLSLLFFLECSLERTADPPGDSRRLGSDCRLQLRAGSRIGGQATRSPAPGSRGAGPARQSRARTVPAGRAEWPGGRATDAHPRMVRLAEWRHLVAAERVCASRLPSPGSLSRAACPAGSRGVGRPGRGRPAALRRRTEHPGSRHLRGDGDESRGVLCAGTLAAESGGWQPRPGSIDAGPGGRTAGVSQPPCDRRGQRRTVRRLRRAGPRHRHAAALGRARPRTVASGGACVCLQLARRTAAATAVEAQG